jgi:plastocyanin
VTIALEARAFSFSPSALVGPAGTPFKIAFHNADAGVPHNVVVPGSGGAQLLSGKIITGDATSTYSVPALAAGAYTFVCVVHPTMTGSLTAR